MKLLDGKIVAKEIKQKIKRQVKELKKKNITPCLAVILVGEDPASHLYVKIKEKTANEVGIILKKYLFLQKTSQKTILDLIKKLNLDQRISGIIVQLPLPYHLDTNKIISAISPLKDVDGLHPGNVGKLLLGQNTIIPPTAAGIIELLKYYKIKLAGKHVVIVGYGKLVGKPLASMIALEEKDATLTICNSQTKNLSYYTHQADILISAAGVAHLVKANMIKKGSVVIDAGTTVIKSEIGNRKSEIVGDVDFEKVKNKTSYITPPKGGVGPMTVMMLLKNVVELRRNYTALIYLRE